MYKEIPGGTKYLIPDAFGVDFECWIPPVGYGLNRMTLEIEPTDIIKRSNKPSEQYWEREDLPDWYKSRRQKEERMQVTNPDYVDEQCEKVREQQWGRRLRGVWFYNDGVPTYITGLHWLMMTWWKFQGIYFDYRVPNMEFFYVIDYCIEDEKCLGDIEITKRKDGKTARAGCFLYEYIARTEAKHGGIQSKTDKDAKEVFKKAIVNPWRKLPHFFRPKYDTSKGDDPDSELRFFNPSKKRTKRVLITPEEEDALESFIDYENRGEMAYDGPELHRYISDESGKLKDVSILKRHGVVKFCSEVDGVFVGKHHYTTTVEEMAAGGSEFHKLVKMSDRRKLNENGRTASGLYVQFLPAYRTLFFDKHGRADEKRAKEYYMNERAGLMHDSQALSSYIRKNPFTLEEAFRIDGEDCIYDSELLNNQLDRLTWGENFTTRGDLVWKDGIRDSEVVWVPNKKGLFEVAKLPPEEMRNKVVKRGNLFFPNNKLYGVAGGDPYDYDKTVDERRSNGTGFFKTKYDSFHADDLYNDTLTIMYSNRPQTASMYYEDMIKLCFFCGCEFLAERNKIGLIRYFESRGYGAFLIKFKGEKEPGIAATPQTKQEMVEITEEFILRCIHKVFFKSLIDQWLRFNYSDTEKFDEAMGSGWTLVADKNRIVRASSEQLINVDDLFQKYAVNA